MSEKTGLGINWINSAGSALAAVSAAVVLSALGTAGTLVGAAMGSLVITVGGALYSRSIQVTRERAATMAARRRVTEAEPAQPDQGAQRVRPRIDTVRPDGAGLAAPKSAYSPPDRSLPWTRIVAGTLALFVVAMGLIVGFELITNRPVSSYTGGSSDTDRGTSIPGTHRDREDKPKEQDQPEPAPTIVSTPTPSDEPTPDEATESPQPQPEPTEPTESAAPSPTPTPPPSATPAAPAPGPAVQPTG